MVENKPSAGGSLGTGQVATATPDGYTLLFSASASINLTPQLQKLAFDPVKQLISKTTNPHHRAILENHHIHGLLEVTGRWEQILYGEFDGRRRKRVLVKIIGD